MPPRTRRLPLALLSVLGLATFAGCADRSEPATVWNDPFCAEVMPRVQAWLDSTMVAHPAPPDDRYGGTLVAAGLEEMTGGGGMNAFVVNDVVTRMHQQFVGLMTLVRYDENIEPLPYLAESWELNDGGTEVTFHLRDDVFWHDGTPTTAHDVAFTYERVTDPAIAFPNDQFFDPWVRGADGVEAIDDHTVRMRMAPHSEFLDPWTAVAVMPRHLLGDVPVDELASHPFGSLCPVGNGPFVFREHVIDQQWTFAANPVFPEALGGRPFLDRYVYRKIPEQSTLFTELLTGGIDFYVQPRPEQVARIEESPDTRVLSFPSRVYAFIGYNTRIPQLSDPRVRRALALGWDREQFVEANLLGHGSVANGPVPPTHWAYDPSAAPDLGYDPEEAVRLLDEAGWVDRDGDGIRENADGVPLSFTIAYNAGNLLRQNAAEFMQSSLREIGVDARAETADYDELVGRVTTPGVDRDFESIILAWTVEFRLDDTAIFHSRSVDGPVGFTGLADPEVDRLLDGIVASDSREEARPLWTAYQERIAELQPYQFLYYPNRIMGLSTAVHGVEADLRGDILNLHEWWLDPAAR